MTVAELIRQLQQLPPDLPVILNLDKNEFANGCDAARVEELGVIRHGDGSHSSDWFAAPLPDDTDRRMTVVNITAKR